MLRQITVACLFLAFFAGCSQTDAGKTQSAQMDSDTQHPFTIHINRQGNISLDPEDKAGQTKNLNIKQLEDQVAPIPQNTAIVIYAASETPHGKVVEIIDLLATHGFKKIHIRTEGRTQRR